MLNAILCIPLTLENILFLINYRTEETPYLIMQLDFEMENFTSQTVIRRIMWHLEYQGRKPPPEMEKAVTELTVIQKDIRAIVPLAMVRFALSSHASMLFNFLLLDFFIFGSSHLFFSFFSISYV